MALRFFLMRTHYRSDVNHSDKALEIASDRVYYIYQVFDLLEILAVCDLSDLNIIIPILQFTPIELCVDSI
jgi:cysteinyl-tRNA synthetase